MAVCKPYGLVSRAASKKEMEEQLCAYCIACFKFHGVLLCRTGQGSKPACTELWPPM